MVGKIFTARIFRFGLALAGSLMLSITLSACQRPDPSEGIPPADPPGNPVAETHTHGGYRLLISSPAFQHGQAIPVEHSCVGENRNPSLTLSGFKPESRSLVLVLEDPDAPGGTYIHWLLWNMPLREWHLTPGTVPENSVRGKNSAGTLDYIGPCPPSGTHRYIFRLYELNTILDLPEGSTYAQLREAMEGHVVDAASLMGTFTATPETAAKSHGARTPSRSRPAGP